jgi:hypothetical protein
MSLFQTSSTLLFVAVASPLALAGFTSAVTPSFAGSPCARFAGWEVFTNAYNGPNAPDMAGTDETSAEITQLIPGAIITSGGNIYDPFQPTAFRLTDTTSAPVQEVVLETSTQGNSRSVTSFTLTYVGANGQDVVLAPTQFIPLVQLPQQHDELYFQWDLSNAGVPITSYHIEWIAQAPSMSFDAALLYVRLACSPAPGASFCAGDGSGTACPCANTGGADRGCANSVNPSGAELVGAGSASLANDTLVLTGNGMPDSTCLYFQGNSMQSAGAGTVFGDGVRCAAGSILRLGTAVNASGASSYPSGSQQSVSARGNVTSSGAIRYYQVWYRNAAAFCTPSTFNTSNGYAVTWQP